VAGRETLRKELEIVNKFRNKEEEERVLKKFSDIDAKKPKSFLYDIGRSKVLAAPWHVLHDFHVIPHGPSHVL
jgi:hypothetical protein